jgi:hypothetical protein
MNKTNKIMLAGILLMAIVVPLTTWLAMTKQDTRRSAAEDTGKVVQFDVVDGACGVANGTDVSSVPSLKDACTKGAVNWMDKGASDGKYDWFCFGSVGKNNASCSATKK